MDSPRDITLSVKLPWQRSAVLDKLPMMPGGPVHLMNHVEGITFFAPKKEPHR
jgi:hypothetical protein